MFFLLVLVLSPLAHSATVLVMGDSLSAGYGLRARDAWPAELQRKLRADGGDHKVVNASISGETTAGGLSRLPHALKTHRPDVVIIELGANDGLRGLPLEAMQSNLVTMIAQSRAAGARVVLVGMRLPPNYGSAYANKFHEVFTSVATSEKTAFVPFLLAGFAERREWFQNDGLHPTREAQGAMVDNIWPALEPLLRRKAAVSAR
jgi:acyl-CoA thioesterase-1